MCVCIFSLLNFLGVLGNSSQLYSLESCQRFLCPSVLSQLGLNSEALWDLAVGLLSPGLVSVR